MKKRVLVVGYTGFIGKVLVEKLRNNNEFNLQLLSKSNGFDVLEYSNIKDIKCDVIINLFGVVSISESWINPKKYYSNNFLGLLNILEIARNNNASLIHVSSYVYGVPEYQPIDEKHKVSGYNPYASSKIMADNLCSDYSKLFQIPITILRPFNLYGEGQNNNFLITNLINALESGDVVNIFDLNAKRDYLLVDDFVDAIIAVLKNQEEGLHLYNIGSGLSYSPEDIIEFISKNFGPINFEYNKNNKLQVQNCICDNKSFIKDFNWKPKVGIFEGISRLINSNI